MAGSPVEQENTTSSSSDDRPFIDDSIDSSLIGTESSVDSSTISKPKEESAKSHHHISDTSNEQTSPPINTNTDEWTKLRQKYKPLLQKLSDKVGKIDEKRLISSESYLNGSEPALFTNLEYTTKLNTNGTEIISVNRRISNKESSTNYISSAALLCGTALGCGLLNLPTAISTSGYLPTLVATLVAWVYMTISALLTSELLINRCGETGRVRNVGLLELYNSYLGNVGGKLAGFGFLIVSYLVLGVYLSEGGDQLMKLLQMSGLDDILDGGTIYMNAQLKASAWTGDMSFFNTDAFVARSIFALGLGLFLSTADLFNTVQKSMTHLFVPLTLVAFLGAVCVGLPTTNFGALIASENQHPEVVLNSFPLLFMSWTYHGVVPRVVYDLEGDKNKITKAILLGKSLFVFACWFGLIVCCMRSMLTRCVTVSHQPPNIYSHIGSTTALIIYLIWNAMILGNASQSGATAASASSLIQELQESSNVVLGDMVSVRDPSAITTVSSTISPSLDIQNFSPLLQSSIAIVSELAVITSLTGVVLGFVNEFNDAIGFENGASKSYGPREDFKKWVVALLTLLPPAFVSIGLGYYSDQFDINNFNIIDYTGIFGASVLFLILPALMAWQSRYGEEDPRPLTVRPMVPLGKISLSSLYKAAGTLILEQGLEKIGVFDFIKGLLHL